MTNCPTPQKNEEKKMVKIVVILVLAHLPQRLYKPFYGYRLRWIFFLPRTLFLWTDLVHLYHHSRQGLFHPKIIDIFLISP